MCGAEEAPYICIRINFAFRNQGMAVLWLQWSSAHYQFVEGLELCLEMTLTRWFLPWSGLSCVEQRLPSHVKTALSHRLMKINNHQTIWDYWRISFHIQQGIASSFYLYLVQTKCLKETFEDRVERLEARQRTNRTSGMRMVVSSTDLLYIPSQGVGSSSDTAWGFLNPAECRDRVSMLTSRGTTGCGWVQLGIFC